MSTHATSGHGAPTFAPPSISAHYTDLLTGTQYIAAGTINKSDWTVVPSLDAAKAAAPVQSVNGQAGAVVLPVLGVGDVQFSYRNPGAGFVPADGALLWQDDYPDLFAIVGLLGGTPPDGTAWEDTFTASSGNFTAIATNGNGVWVAGTSVGGCFRSADEGKTWTDITSKFSGSMFKAIYGAANGYWIVCNNGSSRVSYDNGLNWSSISAVAGVYFNDIGHDGADTWVMVGNGGKLYRSDDGTGSWTLLTSQFGTDSIWAVDTDGAGVWVATGDAGKMARSTDNGATWTALPVMGSAEIRTVRCGEGGVWFAYGSNLYKSTDNGATWANTGIATNDAFKRITHRGTTWIGVGGDYGSVIQYSADNGATWGVASVTGAHADAKWEDVAWGKDNIIAVGYGGSLAVCSQVFAYNTDYRFIVPTIEAQGGAGAYIKATP